jgi:chloramphenicol 3-O-phosphotransferase
MVVFVNGAFGIGKTSVARRLRRELPGSAIFDPELVGLVLRRLPSFVPLQGRGTGDFQDLASWRRISLLGIRGVRALRRIVIVPMAFSRLDYLHELLRGAARFDADVRHFCLVAPLPIVLERLAKRGGDLADPALAWQVRRAEECCVAHRSAEYAEPIEASDRTPEQLAAEIAARIAG